MRRLITAVAMLAGMAFGGAAHSGAIISFQESGGNVTGTLSGSLNLTGLNRTTDWTSTGPFIEPQTARIGFGPSGSLQDRIEAALTGPASFGPGSFSLPSSISGNDLFLDGAAGKLWVPKGYSSGSPLVATMNYTAASFSSLGMTPGDYSYSIGTQDTITVRVGGTVPEPASLALLGLGLAGIGYQRRKRSA